MKKLSLLLIALSLIIQLNAQVPKMVEVTAGKLSSLLTSTELKTVTHLTLTGTLDARDFKILRDSMPVLAIIDLSGVTVAAYSGTAGTSLQDIVVAYPANEIPCNSFIRKTTLTMVTVPLTATSIGIETFYGCTALKDIIIPPSVLSIGNGAFLGCDHLSSIHMPDQLTKIGDNAFGGCTALTTVDIPSSVTDIGFAAFCNCSGLTSITIPTSVTSIKGATFSGCNGFTSFSFPPSVTSIGESAFYGCWRLKSIVFPPSVTSIGNNCFSYCPDITSITIPSSVTSIGNNAFYACNGLSVINANSGIPIDLSTCYNVFSNVNTASCKLIVPYHSKARYAEAPQWKDFSTIEEAASGIALEVNQLALDAWNHSYTIGISANVEWSVHSCQPWLAFDTPSGNGDHRITLTIEENPTLYRRIGQITVSAPETVPQIIEVTQEGAAKTIITTPGSLISFLTDEEMWNRITTLTLEGTIDARDFKTIRDKMPMLTTLDLSHTTVAAYTGTDGTLSELTSYVANKIPRYAFSNPYDYYPYVSHKNENINKDKYKTIVLPSTITAIAKFAFFDCDGLTSIEIPEGLKEIQDAAFNQCNNLKSITLPSTLIVLGNEVFGECTSLQSIDLPASLISIGARAFYACISLKSVNIPATVTFIGSECFSYCRGLTSITASSDIPVDLSQSREVFKGVDQTVCKLIVPYHSEARYAEALQWKDFNIVESASGISLDVNHLEFDSTMHRNTFIISANVGWTVSSSQPWLSIDTPLGNGDHQVTFTLEANPTYYTREAQITVSSTDATSQIITVIQFGQTKTIKLTAGLLFSLLTYEEMKGITYLTLEGTIDARDFKVLRDRMPSLTTLDLSHTTIVAYTGTECTYPDPLSIIYYPADKVPDYAFFNIYSYTIKDNLKSIVLPMTIKSIGEAAFKDCDGLISIEIPEGVTEIETSVFSDCINLISISLPSTLNRIGLGSFYRCLNLRSIYAYNATPVVIQQNNEVFLLVDQESCILHVPAGSRKDYSYAYQWRDFKHIVDLPTATNELKLNYTQVTCYPNPFIDQISIEIANPSLKEVNIDIYNISGQKIRSLARALKGPKISLSWDGNDAQGRKVAPGVYLLKVNGGVRKVVKE